MVNIYLRKNKCFNIINCFRLIVGGQDGSVTILVVAQLEDENTTDEETISNTANYRHGYHQTFDPIYICYDTKTIFYVIEVHIHALNRKIYG